MPSRCIREAVRGFFSNGSVPAEGTVCATDYPPFSDPQEEQLMTSEEGKGLRAQARLGQILPLARQGLPFGHLLH